MLELARQKLPGARFVQADMTEVRLGETFDVVLCVYDSINHLLRFEDWERAFDTAREHLGPEGVFVFDVNTRERLQAFADGRSVAEDFGEGNVLVIAVESSGQDIFTWQLRVFERLGDGEFRLHQEAIREAVFPVDRIRAGLGGRFGAVHELESGGRLYCACTAAWATEGPHNAGRAYCNRWTGGAS